MAALRQQLADSHRAVEELRGEVAELKRRLAQAMPHDPATPQPPSEDAEPASRPAGVGGLPCADRQSSQEAKVALYRALFVGRDDVYARRWENAAKGTSGWQPAHRSPPGTPPERRELLPLTDDVVVAHLSGRHTVGLYPLLDDHTCRLLACDFDKATWRLDARAYVDAARAAGVPTAVEISRSGDGAHVWIFFSARVAATDARALGGALLREAMALRGELDLDSYDRLFPSQDYLPERGFGNLIALPLQGRSRFEDHTTVFVDPETFEPWSDQFAFLGSLSPMTPAEVRHTLDVLRPVAVGPDTRLFHSSLRPEPAPPEPVKARLASMLAMRRAGLPPGLHASLKHLAVLSNPEFHKNQNLRLSNHATPRFVRCYEEDVEHLYLPRGLADQAAEIVEEAGSRLEVTDARPEPVPVDLGFAGDLHDRQKTAVDELARHDLGVLQAPAGTGKTVMGCALIARHRTPALVLVDRTWLLDQWREHLRTHLGVEPGQIGAGKKRPTGVVDVAMVQTVIRSDDPGELLAGYGLVVVDECHHVSAPTVERAVRDVCARRWLGLTATPRRPDGLEEIMIMQCGPIRHRIRERDRDDDLVRMLQVHHTDLTIDTPTDGLSRGELLALVYDALVADEGRTTQVCGDVAGAVGAGRNCLVLSGRTEHVRVLADGLRRHGLDSLVVHGGLSATEQRAAHQRLADDEPLLVVATDRYVGEGFDCPRLDTLFLAFPVSAPQRITQYVGRILREHPEKDQAEVHDYLDADVPVLAAMYRRRRTAYRELGFSSEQPTTSGSQLRLPRSSPSQGPPQDAAGQPGDPPEPRPSAPEGSDGRAQPSAAEVRAWARDAGYAVAERGRLSVEIWQAYRNAHPKGVKG